MENAASTYFGELLNEFLEEDEQVAPLTTRVAITDQNVGLTGTGERLQFDVSSIVHFQYIGEKEIPSITDDLQTLVNENSDAPAYSNLEILTGARPASSFAITFTNTTTNSSTLLYTVMEYTPSSESNNGHTGLIVACTLATISLVLASLVLLWAVGFFDGWKPCKNLRARFYLPPLRTPESPLPYGMTAKSTAEETETGDHYGAAPIRHDDDDDDEESALQDQGIEMTPSRGIFREDESDMISPADSIFSDGDTTDISHVSSVAPLGIASMRKEKRNAAQARNTIAHSATAPMSPESILADIQSIQSMPIDLD